MTTDNVQCPRTAARRAGITSNEIEGKLLHKSRKNYISSARVFAVRIQQAAEYTHDGGSCPFA